MHYAKLLSGKGLFARFGGWFAECRNDEKRGINEFLFRATSAVLALEEMHFHERCCLENFRQIKPQLTLKRARLFLWSPIGPVISPIHAISVVRAFSPKCPVAHGSAKTRIANQHPEESPRRDSQNSELWSP